MITKDKKEAFSWNCRDWLFKYYNFDGNSDHYRSLRREVFQNTVNIIKSGSYVSFNYKNIEFDLLKFKESLSKTQFYPDTRLIDKDDNVLTFDTKCYTIEADCLETAKLLQLMGYKPAVLNMASNSNPGGGVLNGSGAQEENLFRRSTLLCSMYQFVEYGMDYGVPRNDKFSYPIPRESGGIYSPGIIVFRSSEKTGYALLDNPYLVDVISVAAISYPELIESDIGLRIADKLIEPTKEKIRAIFRIGLQHAHDAMVLSAFGCGAFANPPVHMAELFADVLNEDEFKNRYSLIVFAIIDDHNTRKTHNPDGNVLPFQMQFN